MYLGSNSGQPDLFTMNPDGTHLVQVTNTPVTENFPNWGTHPVAPSTDHDPATRRLLSRVAGSIRASFLPAGRPCRRRHRRVAGREP